MNSNFEFQMHNRIMKYKKLLNVQTFYIYIQTLIKYYKTIFVLFFVINFGSCDGETNKSKNKERFILVWPTARRFDGIFGKGQEVFLQSECRHDQCYVTTNSALVEGDFGRYDAIIFDGSDPKWHNNLPFKRYPHQKYIFMQTDSAAETVVCDKVYDNFFNWTITYKTNSDIIFPYFQVKDTNDETIAPHSKVFWNTYMTGNVDVKLTESLKSKKKPVAWIQTNMTSNNNRKLVKWLQAALDKYSLKIDILEKCGGCNDIVIRDYFFYLALEDSYSEDYVTSKVLLAIDDHVVPIVLGAVDYTRFLPPGSYIDARQYTPKKLASIIFRLTKDPKKYSSYFRWKKYYTFCEGPATLKRVATNINQCGAAICHLCEALHNPKQFGRPSVYTEFRKWWYPNYETACERSKKLRNINLIGRAYERALQLYLSARVPSTATPAYLL